MKRTRITALILALVMLLACAACSGGESEGNSGGGDTNQSNSNNNNANSDNNGGSDGAKSYTIGYNNFGQGAYPLDLNEANTKYAVDSMGSAITVVNNQFTVDKLITDAQNQISQGVDGMVFWSAADTLFQPFSELCSNSQTPFALGDKYPATDATIAMLRENPYFVGAISTNDSAAGAVMAQTALADGHTTAIIVAAAVGDINHDLRVAGFTDAFTAGGGEILGVVHCADPSEAVQKANDLLTAHPDVECAYGSGGDYTLGLMSALEGIGRDGEIPIYGTDVDPDTITGIRKGTVAAANGAAGCYCGGIAAALLINYLDGHPILDENGQAPTSNAIEFIMVTKDNVDQYEENWITNQIFTPEEYQALLYRYNPDVTWGDYEDLIANYTFEGRMATK